MINESFDPYHRWLGIPPKHQPPDYYRLLALERFEDDEEVIRDASEQRIAHVRNYRLGEHAELAHKLLNELGRAKACLLDDQKRADYDQELRTQHQQTSEDVTSVVSPAVETPVVDTGSSGRLAHVDRLSLGTPSVHSDPAVPNHQRAETPAPASYPLHHTPNQAVVDAAFANETPVVQPVATTDVPVIVPSASSPNNLGSTEFQYTVRKGIDPSDIAVKRRKRRPSKERGEKPRSTLRPDIVSKLKSIPQRINSIRRAIEGGNKHASWFMRLGFILLLSTIIIFVCFLIASRVRNQLVERNEVLAQVIDQQVKLADTVQLKFGVDSDRVRTDGIAYRLEPNSVGAQMIDTATGQFEWKAMRPGKHVFTVQAVNKSGNAVDQHTFKVFVEDTSRPPQLRSLSDQSVDETKKLTLDLSVADPGRPWPEMRYSLLPGSPEGALLDPKSGRFTWTPTEMQGPGTYEVKVRVEAREWPQSNAEMSFPVNVAEVTEPPQFRKVPKTVHVDAGGEVRILAEATDTDYPARPIEYELIAGEKGAEFDSTTGTFVWKPTNLDLGTRRNVVIQAQEIGPKSSVARAEIPVYVGLTPSTQFSQPVQQTVDLPPLKPDGPLTSVNLCSFPIISLDPQNTIFTLQGVRHACPTGATYWIQSTYNTQATRISGDELVWTVYLNDKVPIAEFRVEDRKLTFRWRSEARQNIKEANYLRNCVFTGKGKTLDVQIALRRSIATSVMNLEMRSTNVSRCEIPFAPDPRLLQLEILVDGSEAAQETLRLNTRLIDGSVSFGFKPDSNSIHKKLRGTDKEVILFIQSVTERLEDRLLASLVSLPVYFAERRNLLAQYDGNHSCTIRYRIVYDASVTLELAAPGSVRRNNELTFAEGNGFRAFRSEELVADWRKAGHHSATLDLLEIARESPNLSPAFKETVSYDKGLTMIRMSESELTLPEKEKWLANACDTLQEFFTTRRTHPYAALAQYEFGVACHRRALLSLDRAVSEQSVHYQHLAYAYKMFDSAARAFDETSDDVADRLKRFGTLDPENASHLRLIKIRDRYRNDWLRAKLHSAIQRWDRVILPRSIAEGSIGSSGYVAMQPLLEFQRDYSDWAAVFYAEYCLARFFQDIGDETEASRRLTSIVTNRELRSTDPELVTAAGIALTHNASNKDTTSQSSYSDRWSLFFDGKFNLLRRLDGSNKQDFPLQ